MQSRLGGGKFRNFDCCGFKYQLQKKLQMDKKENVCIMQSDSYTKQYNAVEYYNIES